ncbi:hypothetical protein C0Z01_14185 [Photobacterium kishitanii]|uniref:hypothetical protein n=1 Tax=Photobacterium kishitanii TaxID=318456 RepID=UPI0007EFFDE6|nr:hypothetical protein [Photobacterium kishitanii]OBU24959.1 hypothetical protein AYY22_21030 [Photobacterium kishitanii]PSW68705.1 hypothetical protein C0Z01_14185 [Photobacterium kishitanii]
MSELELDRNELDQVELMASDLDGDSSGGSEVVTDGNSNNELKHALSICMLGTFSVVAPNWGVSADECNALAECYSTVIDKYFPDAGDSYGVEISALLMTVGVIGSRVMQNIPRKNIKKDELQHVGGGDESKNSAAG